MWLVPAAAHARPWHATPRCACAGQHKAKRPLLVAIRSCSSAAGRAAPRPECRAHPLCFAPPASQVLAAAGGAWCAPWHCRPCVCAYHHPASVSAPPPSPWQPPSPFIVRACPETHLPRLNIFTPPSLAASSAPALSRHTHAGGAGCARAPGALGLVRARRAPHQRRGATRSPPLFGSQAGGIPMAQAARFTCPNMRACCLPLAHCSQHARAQYSTQQ
jgi:hypothetical protein